MEEALGLQLQQALTYEANAMTFIAMLVLGLSISNLLFRLVSPARIFPEGSFMPDIIAFFVCTLSYWLLYIADFHDFPLVWFCFYIFAALGTVELVVKKK